MQTAVVAEEAIMNWLVSSQALTETYCGAGSSLGTGTQK